MSIHKSLARRLSFESIHSIRLFPKSQVPDGYQITGIAARCDWQVMSCEGGMCRLFRNDIDNPQTIFLSLRGLFPAFQYFLNEVMPAIPGPYVLISGSEDITVPNQTDCRWPAFNFAQKAVLEQIRCDERLISWFAENLDELKPKMVPLPTGYVFAGSGAPVDFVEVADVRLSSRPLKVFCAHRVREGSQWAARKRVSSLCQNEWHSFTTFVQDEVPLETFMTFVRDHPFVLCVEGGGLDPSPKAWLTLALGSIPIMRRSPTTDAYEKSLPVALVDNWEASALSPSIMRDYRERLSPWFERDELRLKLEERLSISYWWTRIQSMFSDPDGSQPR
jgi:hypothetical protein